MNLKIDPRLLPRPTRGQLALMRAEKLELSEGNEVPQYEDIHNRLNRHERRVVESEARSHRKLLDRRDARKKIRADKRAKKMNRALVEL